jgi:hypothetical protein
MPLVGGGLGGSWALIESGVADPLLDALGQWLAENE